MIKKNNKLLLTYIFIIFTVLIFILSFIVYKSKNYGVRRTFVFPSVDAGQYVVETRYLSKSLVSSDISFYTDEILLGSSLERTKLLFTAGTKKLSCFERNGILYLNLSADLLKMGDNVIEINSGVDLLKQNISMNFPNIKKIEIFVDGKYAYENEKN